MRPGKRERSVRRNVGGARRSAPTLSRSARSLPAMVVSLGRVEASAAVQIESPRQLRNTQLPAQRTARSKRNR